MLCTSFCIILSHKRIWCIYIMWKSIHSHKNVKISSLRKATTVQMLLMVTASSMMSQTKFCHSRHEQISYSSRNGNFFRFLVSFMHFLDQSYDSRKLENATKWCTNIELHLYGWKLNKILPKMSVGTVHFD